MDTGDKWGARSRRGLLLLATAVRKQPLAFAGALLGSSVYAATTVFTAWLLGRVSNQVLSHQHSFSGIAGDTAALVIAAFIQLLGFVCREALAGLMRRRLQADLRRALVRRFATLAPAWQREHSTGDLLSILDADVEATWQAVRLLPSACSALMMLVLGITAMFFASPGLGWVGLALLTVSLGFSLAYEHRAGPLVARLHSARGQLAAVAHESFEAALLVKATGRHESEAERFAAAAEVARRASLAAGRVRSVFDPVMQALPSLSVLATLLIGALGVRAGTLQPGNVVQVTFLIAFLSLPMASVGWIVGEFPHSATAYARVESVPDATSARQTSPPDGSRAPARVALDRVTLAYPAASEPALRDVSLEVAAGSLVAVVGRSGSGKSSLCAVISGMLDPLAGAVRVDGVDVSRQPASGIASRVALVPQHPFLFLDSVRANIALGFDVCEQEIWTALILARADDFVRALPCGLDTVIGERGHTLSGGQRQRLTLARALVRRPALLILDDATSAVDPRVESAILDGLGSLRPRLTTVMASSSLAVVERADNVVFLDQGTVRDCGAHRDVLLRSPEYGRLIAAYRRDQERRFTDARATCGENPRENEGCAA